MFIGEFHVAKINKNKHMKGAVYKRYFVGKIGSNPTYCYMQQYAALVD